MIWEMIKKSEFKRYQSTIGPKISGMSFDKDRRFPITNNFFQFKMLRFAPSPTGFLHIGNARVAVLNYLYSKKNDLDFFFSE